MIVQGDKFYQTKTSSLKVTRINLSNDMSVVNKWLQVIQYVNFKWSKMYSTLQYDESSFHRLSCPIFE